MTARAFAGDVPALKVSARRRGSYRGSSALRRTGSGSGTPAGSELAFGSPPAGAPCPSRQPIWTSGLTTRHTSARALPHSASATATRGGSHPIIHLGLIASREETGRPSRTCGGSLVRGTPERLARSDSNRPGIPLGKRPRGYHRWYVRGCFYGPDPDRRRLLEDAPPTPIETDIRRTSSREGQDGDRQGHRGPDSGC